MNGTNYNHIAAILAGDLATCTTDRERYKVSGIAYSLADYFARENPRFVRDRFYAAVGIPLNEPFVDGTDGEWVDADTAPDWHEPSEARLPWESSRAVDDSDQTTGWSDFTGMGEYRTIQQRWAQTQAEVRHG